MAREEEDGGNGEVDVKRRDGLCTRQTGHRIMASRHYDRGFGSQVLLLFDFWGIEKHEPMGWIRMQLSFSF